MAAAEMPREGDQGDSDSDEYQQRGHWHQALARARIRGLMFMTGMVDDDNRKLGKDEFRDIERKMLSDKGAKKVLSGLKDECRMALVVAFANVIRASGTKEKEENEPNGAESDSWMWPVLAILADIGALSLAQWL